MYIFRLLVLEIKLLGCSDVAERSKQGEKKKNVLLGRVCCAVLHFELNNIFCCVKQHIMLVNISKYEGPFGVDCICQNFCIIVNY